MPNKKMALTVWQQELATILGDKQRAKQRVKKVMVMALSDHRFWKDGGRGGLIKSSLLYHLGFTSVMSVSTISRYWEMIVSNGIFPKEWEIKAVLVLEALGFDATTWLRLQIQAGKGLKTISRILTKMIKAKGGVLSVGEESVKLAIGRLLSTDAMQKVDFLKLAKRDPVAAKTRVIQLMESALLESDFWDRGNGKLKKRRFLEKLGLRVYQSPTTYVKLWQEFRQTGLWNPLCEGKAAFALQTLGSDPLKWVTDNRRFEHSLRAIAEEINLLLKERGFPLQVGIDSVRPLRVIALQHHHQT